MKITSPVEGLNDTTAIGPLQLRFENGEALAVKDLRFEPLGEDLLIQARF